MKFTPPKPKPIQFTKEGYHENQKEFDKLTKDRKNILVRLQTAREMGDLSENGAYKYAKFELRNTDRKLRQLTRFLRYGVIVKSKDKHTVSFDNTVTLDNGTTKQKFKIVSGYESDPNKNKLSLYSPIGKAIKGKKVGDKVDVQIPTGTIAYTIIDIS